MDTKSLLSFCELLKGDQSERKTGEMLLSGEYFKQIQNLSKYLAWESVRRSVFQRPFGFMEEYCAQSYFIFLKIAILI